MPRPAPLEPDHHRLFVGVALPPADRDAVAGLVGRVRSVVEGDGPEVRWVRLEGLHLTLRFLGATPADRVPVVEDCVRAAAATAVPFEVRLAGAGAFPTDRRPRVLWLGIEAGAAKLGRLAEVLESRLVDAGWAAEPRPFRAHLTLARADGVRSGASTAAALRTAAASFSTAWTASRLTLFESHMGGGPARYEPLLEAPFGG